MSDYKVNPIKKVFKCQNLLTGWHLGFLGGHKLKWFGLVWFGMVGIGYVMNVGRGYVINVGRGYVIQNGNQ